MTPWFLKTDVPTYSMQIDIEGLVYSAVFKWNPTDGYWYLDLLDEAEQTEQGIRGRRLRGDLGPWLTVDPSSKISTAKLLKHYDLASGSLPGALLCVTALPLVAPAAVAAFAAVGWPVLPLQGVPVIAGQPVPTAAQLAAGPWAYGQQDAGVMQLNYYSAAELAQGGSLA